MNHTTTYLYLSVWVFQHPFSVLLFYHAAEIAVDLQAKALADLYV